MIIHTLSKKTVKALTRAMCSSSASTPRVAIVTGGSRGIGFGIAKQLASEGCRVMICGRSAQRVAEALALFHEQGFTSITGVPCHVGKEDHLVELVKATVQHHGGIDILVNNAATNPIVDTFDPLEFSPNQWRKLMEVNLEAPCHLTRLCVPEMEKRGSGVIVNMSSFAGHHPMPFIGPYGASKAALNMMTKIHAARLVKSNIRVNAIACGYVATEFTTKGTEQLKKEVYDLYNIQDDGKPEDIAKVVSFLCSDLSCYVNGQIIQATGGPAPIFNPSKAALTLPIF